VRRITFCLGNLFLCLLVLVVVLLDSFRSMRVWRNLTETNIPPPYHDCGPPPLSRMMGRNSVTISRGTRPFNHPHYLALSSRSLSASSSIPCHCQYVSWKGLHFMDRQLSPFTFFDISKNISLLYLSLDLFLSYLSFCSFVVLSPRAIMS